MKCSENQNGIHYFMFVKKFGMKKRFRDVYMTNHWYNTVLWYCINHIINCLFMSSRFCSCSSVAVFELSMSALRRSRNCSTSVSLILFLSIFWCSLKCWFILPQLGCSNLFLHTDGRCSYQTLRFPDVQNILQFSKQVSISFPGFWILF